MRNVIATILILMLCGCRTGGDQNNRQAEVIRQDGFATEQIPVRDLLPRPATPAAMAAPEKKSESRAEVVPLPADVEVDSTASNNANQQSATGLANVQIAKIAESVDASLVKLDSKISAQNEMSATAIADLRADMKAELSALASAQAGIANQQSTNTAGHDMTTTFTDGMERLMSHMVSVIYWISAAFIGTYFASVVSVLVAFIKLIGEQSRLRERDEKRDDALMSQVLKGARA